MQVFTFGSYFKPKAVFVGFLFIIKEMSLHPYGFKKKVHISVVQNDLNWSVILMYMLCMMQSFIVFLFDKCY